MEFVEASHQSLSVTNARLRAEEPSRYVFAVFYQEPGVRVAPGRYKLVAVNRTGAEIEELPASPGSPYWIGGLK